MKLLVMLLVATVGLSYGQTPLTLYFDANGQPTTKAGASTYAVVTRDRKDTTLYATQTFGVDQRPLADGDYRAVRFPVRWGQLLALDFTDAFREGTHREYHPGGQLKFKGDFRGGRGEGLHRRWYESGQLLSEGQLVNGHDEGSASDYYENGQVKLQLSYLNGLPDGQILEYHPTGKKKARATMKKGARVGKLVRYDEQENELPD